MLMLYRLNDEVIDLPHMADTLDKSSNLAERDSLSGIAVPDNRYKGAVVWGVRTEYNLG